MLESIVRLDYIMSDVSILVAGVSVGLLLSLIGSRTWIKWSEKVIHLRDVVRGAELICKNLFQSVEAARKNMESLLDRADRAEKNLQRFINQVEEGKTDRYSSASHLLSEGKEVEQVARTLKLPLAQVRLVQELRWAVKKRGTADSRDDLRKESPLKEEVKKQSGALARENAPLRLDSSMVVAEAGGNGSGPEEKAPVRTKAKRQNDVPSQEKTPVRTESSKVIAGARENGGGSEEKTSVRARVKRQNGAHRREKIAVANNGASA